MGKYDGMTTLERLFVAELLESFDAAAKIRDENKMVEILMKTEFSEIDARSIAETTLKNPKMYGY